MCHWYIEAFKWQSIVKAGLHTDHCKAPASTWFHVMIILLLFYCFKFCISCNNAVLLESLLCWYFGKYYHVHVLLPMFVCALWCCTIIIVFFSSETPLAALQLRDLHSPHIKHLEENGVHIVMDRSYQHVLRIRVLSLCNTRSYTVQSEAVAS